MPAMRPVPCECRELGRRARQGLGRSPSVREAELRPGLLVPLICLILGPQHRALLGHHSWWG